MLYKSESAMCPTDDTAVSGTACLPACQVQAILNIATGRIALTSRSDYYVTPLLKTFRWLFISIMVKAQILTMTKASLNLTPPPYPLWHHLLLLSPLLTLVQPHWPTCFSLNMQSALPPWRLCTGCSLCLECSSSIYPYGYLSPLNLGSNVYFIVITI